MSRFASRAPWHHARKLTAFALSFLLAANSFPCLAQAAQASSVDKAETVYVYNNADGSVRQITSKIVLANDAQAESITDETALADIDSEQTFSADPNTGKLTWKTDGKEVQYQGTTDAQPPLAVHVTYTLDGAVVSPSQLAGKSGHLSMRYDFENTSWHGSLIDGSLTRVYTPFVAVASVTLPHSVFRNVSIENGKLTDGASSSMALGYALPGMQQSLDLSIDDADIPDHFVIEADVTDFELASVAIIVTPELLRDLDTSNLDTGELSDSMDALQDAVAALSEGSDTPTGALDQIADGEDQLVSGIDQFKEQTAAIPEATGALSSGASALADGVANAAAGATGLVEGTAAVRDAIDAVRTQALPLATEALDGARKALAPPRRRSRRSPRLPTHRPAALQIPSPSCRTCSTKRVRSIRWTTNSGRRFKRPSTRSPRSRPSTPPRLQPPSKPPQPSSKAPSFPWVAWMRRCRKHLPLRPRLPTMPRRSLTGWARRARAQAPSRLALTSSISPRPALRKASTP